MIPIHIIDFLLEKRGNFSPLFHVIGHIKRIKNCKYSKPNELDNKNKQLSFIIMHNEGCSQNTGCIL